MTEWTDIMVDVETTGTDIRSAGIIQLSAVMFNLSTGEIGPEFDRCLMLNNQVVWESQTYEWWQINKDRSKVFDEIVAREEDPAIVINDFIRWNRVNGPVKHFWSKPSHFDYTLLDKYFRMYGYKNPFVYWKARDMRSYILGLVFPEELPDLKLKSEDAHNALADVKFQINELIKITREKKRCLTDK